MLPVFIFLFLLPFVLLPPLVTLRRPPCGPEETVAPLLCPDNDAINYDLRVNLGGVRGYFIPSSQL